MKAEECGFKDGGAAAGGKCRVEGGAAAVSARYWQRINVGLEAPSSRDGVDEVLGGHAGREGDWSGFSFSHI